MDTKTLNVSCVFSKPTELFAAKVLMLICYHQMVVYKVWLLFSQSRSQGLKKKSKKKDVSKLLILIYPLTTRVVGAPQIISQPVWLVYWYTLQPRVINRRVWVAVNKVRIIQLCYECVFVQQIQESNFAWWQ